ncbi:hypothetical protein ACF1G0_30440 [Streptomyces sp. NPDC013953]|uniref:hypothetical protein n=1 Tax=Streptomyces sp. NPDC013953 TaxID=3364868 RepID=UPI0037024FD0
MIESFHDGEPDQDAEEMVRRSSFGRHALWVVGVTAFAVALGWATALVRIGPDQSGLPPALPGSVWPYLTVWGVTGLTVAAMLRATAAKVPLYAAGRTAMLLTALGTRLSLGWRPEALVLAALITAALAWAALWCAFALRTTRPRKTAGDAAPDERPGRGASPLGK